VLCYATVGVVHNQGKKMKSMTGYGKASCEREGREVTVEIKSVNHRFLDLNLKLPKIFFPCEERVRKTVAQYVTRGHLDVYINYTDYAQTNKELVVDENLAAAYVETARMLSEKFGVENDYTVKMLMKTSDVLTVRAKDVADEFWAELVADAVSAALCELDKMRITEGEKLRNDLEQRIDTVEEFVAEIAKIAPTVSEDYKQRLEARIKELLAGIQPDEAKLCQEVAFFADKSNIDEELTRLNSHIVQYRAILENEKPTGRQLDFLVQELNREVNTICSKSNNLVITNTGLRLKNEIEKIREQIQNIE